jgi:hypothetical protein
LRSPIQAAATLLGIFIAMYLAVAGLIHVVTTPDAIAAVVPHHSMTMSMPAAASSSETRSSTLVGTPASTPDVSKASTDVSSVSAIEPKGDNRQCKLSLVIDPDCVFD